METPRIYFDMDGVLADFTRGVKELCGMNPPEQGKFGPDEDAEMWKKIRGPIISMTGWS